MRIIHIFIAVLLASFTLNGHAVTAHKNRPAVAKQQQKASVSKKNTPVKKASFIHKKATSKKMVLQSKKGKLSKRAVRAAYEAPSLGRISGLHSAPDALDLKSSVALVVDQDTNEVLFSKNDSAILPIASITKLMTGVVLSEAKLPMNEIITITQEDAQNAGFSRLKPGTSMSRQDMLHLALMSSENRAAYALGRTYPGGMAAFVRLMNAKALALGMTNTHYVEPTGLSSDNRSTAQDLAKLVAFASHNATVSELSTSHGYQLAVGNRTMNYVNTNRLTSNPNWEIEIQKTGYISAAGRCLVMQTKVSGRKLVMVFLDSMGKYSRIGDAERVRAWVESHSSKIPRA